MLDQPKLDNIEIRKMCRFAICTPLHYYVLYPISFPSSLNTALFRPSNASVHAYSINSRGAEKLNMNAFFKMNGFIVLCKVLHLYRYVGSAQFQFTSVTSVMDSECTTSGRPYPRRLGHPSLTLEYAPLPWYVLYLYEYLCDRRYRE